MCLSVAGLWEAEVAPSVSHVGETYPMCPVPRALQSSFPVSGDSACPPSHRAFLREIPNFILELRLESSSVSASQLCPEALFYLVSHYSLVPLDLFGKSSVLGVTLEW